MQATSACTVEQRRVQQVVLEARRRACQSSPPKFLNAVNSRRGRCGPSSPPVYASAMGDAIQKILDDEPLRLNWWRRLPNGCVRIITSNEWRRLFEVVAGSLGRSYSTHFIDSARLTIAHDIAGEQPRDESVQDGTTCEPREAQDRTRQSE